MSWLDTLDQVRTKDFRNATAEEREKACRDVVNMCSYAVAATSVSPLPFSDALLVLPIQSAMVITIGHIHGRRLDKAAAKDLIVELGTVAGLGFLARQGIKALLPVVGALLTVPAAYAANWGIGRVAMEYFQNPDLSKEMLRSIYARAKEEGIASFSKSAFDEFRRKHKNDLDEAAQQQAAQEPSEPASQAEPAPKAKASAKKAGKTLGRAKGTSAKKRAAAPAAKRPLGRKAPK